MPHSTFRFKASTTFPDSRSTTEVPWKRSRVACKPLQIDAVLISNATNNRYVLFKVKYEDRDIKLSNIINPFNEILNYHD